MMPVKNALALAQETATLVILDIIIMESNAFNVLLPVQTAKLVVYVLIWSIIWIINVFPLALYHSWLSSQVTADSVCLHARTQKSSMLMEPVTRHVFTHLPLSQSTTNKSVAHLAQRDIQYFIMLGALHYLVLILYSIN